MGGGGWRAEFTGERFETRNKQGWMNGWISVYRKKSFTT